MILLRFFKRRRIGRHRPGIAPLAPAPDEGVAYVCTRASLAGVTNCQKVKL